MRLPKVPHIAIVLLIVLAVLYVLRTRSSVSLGPVDDPTQHPAAN